MSIYGGGQGDLALLYHVYVCRKTRTRSMPREAKTRGAVGQSYNLKHFQNLFIFLQSPILATIFTDGCISHQQGFVQVKLGISWS